MDWYRQHLQLMRQLAEQGTTCACCERPLIEEGHEQVFSLNPELPSGQLREMIPSFKLFVVYMIQCECGAWFHGDCLMTLQREATTSVDIRQPNGLVTTKQGTSYTIHCPKCGQLLWEIRGQEPHRWRQELPIRLPHPSDKQAEFLRSYELYLRPHLGSWPSLYLRPRGKGHRAWLQQPFPRAGIIPSAEEISHNRGWIADKTQAAINHIVQEICTNQITIQEILGDHIAERERTRTEREHLATAHAVARHQTPDSRHQENEKEPKPASWLGLFRTKKS